MSIKSSAIEVGIFQLKFSHELSSGVRDEDRMAVLAPIDTGYLLAGTSNTY